jgi:hypothetical protein
LVTSDLQSQIERQHVLEMIQMAGVSWWRTPLGLRRTLAPGDAGLAKVSAVDEDAAELPGCRADGFKPEPELLLFVGHVGEMSPYRSELSQ